MSYDDTSSTGSKSPKARDDSSSYFGSLHTLHNISPSAKSPGMNIPSPSSSGLRQRRYACPLFFSFNVRLEPCRFCEGLLRTNVQILRKNLRLQFN